MLFGVYQCFFYSYTDELLEKIEKIIIKNKIIEKKIEVERREVKNNKMISIEKYKKIYNKTIKEPAKKDFSKEIKIIILVFGIFTIAFAFLSIFVEPSLIIGVFVFFALLLFFIAISYIKNNYNFEIKKEFVDIEALKKEYRKLIKERAKKKLFIILGMYVFLYISLLSIFCLLHITIDNDSNFIFLSIIGIFLGFVILINSEINFYKDKISEKEFEKIEEKVESEYKILI